ncbi:OmpA family protein [Gaoshiqia sediminis]|uniref:OmpA family protein n=1 Tax=Gaoshiqia sediminis TaxID=2986998 RepID=A0AA41YAC8_9BACT|nr:OmpA family protein [Gaoshiqia sediminis]MCW0484267.1 OmpA family protein [Gaoshiqia sediminis]
MKKKFSLLFPTFLLAVFAAFSQSQQMFEDQRILVEPFEANTALSDFGPAFVGNELFFNSISAVGPSMGKNKYYGLYASTIDADGRFLSSSVGMAISSLHNGPLSFCEKTGQLFLTQSNNDNALSKKGIFKERRFPLSIVIYERAGDGWKMAGQFPYNNSQYSVGHPAINVTGDTLVFVSDMPGGRGETDLYYSAKVAGQWQEPVRLSDDINTAGSEMFPFLDVRGNLIFSSDGHGGKGGLDLFQSNLNPAFGVVEMGEPFNSEADDFGLIFSPDRGFGYFVSNRAGGIGDDDIYLFNLDEYQIDLVTASKQTGDVLPGVSIIVYDHQGDLVTQGKTNNQGQLPLKFIPGLKYRLEALYPDYHDAIYDISMNATVGSAIPEGKIFLDPIFQVAGQVLSADQTSPLPGARILVFQDEQLTDSLFADAQGDFNMRIYPGFNYRLLVSAAKFMATTEEFSTNDIKPGVMNLAVKLSPLTTGTRIELENIYYEFGSYAIQDEAVRELDKLVSLMKEYPDMRIKIESHTDARGSNSYNMKLSKKRAQEIYKYLLAREIVAGRLEFAGYGETQLVNQCADGVDCPEEEHARNRRTVIEIL